jgi:hypothetical protein
VAPMPKRSTELIRRNKPDIPVEKVEVIGPVYVPALGIDDPHPIIREMYISLKESGQSRYYEPSDWQYARFVMHFADQLLKSARPSGQMLATVQTMMSNLLMTEGDRRRVRLEVERNTDSGGEVLQVADLFRQRLLQG